MTSSNRGFQPRNGHTLVVGIVARISGCQNQKELSLDDQVDHAKQEIAQFYVGPVDYRIIATKGKGERLDRPELVEIEVMLRSRKLDLLVAEDIGRMVRGAEAVHICGIAVDHGTRVIAPNDCIDTADDSWEEDVISACRDHVGHNAHTSKRLKQKLMNRFKKFGGAVALPVAGYIKPEGAKTYDDWLKDDAATPIIKEGARRLALRILPGAGTCRVSAPLRHRPSGVWPASWRAILPVAMCPDYKESPHCLQSPVPLRANCGLCSAEPALGSHPVATATAYFSQPIKTASAFGRCAIRPPSNTDWRTA